MPDVKTWFAGRSLGEHREPPAPGRKGALPGGPLALAALALALLAGGPFLFGTYLLNVLIQAFFFSMVAVTVDLLWGYTVT